MLEIIVTVSSLFQTLDGEMFDKIREYFSTLGKALLDISTLEKEQSESFVSQAEMVSS